MKCECVSENMVLPKQIQLNGWSKFSFTPFWDAALGSYIYGTNQLISSQLIKQLMHASHAFVVLFVVRKSLFCAMHATAQCCIPKKE